MNEDAERTERNHAVSRHSNQTDIVMNVIRSGMTEEQEIRWFVEELLYSAYLSGKKDILKEMQPAMDALKSLREIM